MKLTEAQIQLQICEALRFDGWQVYVMSQPTVQFAHKGMSDLIVMKKGRVIFMEVKTPKGKQSDHQRQFQNELINSGVSYMLVRSLDDIEDLLESLVL